MLYQLSLALLFYGVFSLFAAIGLPFACRFIGNKELAYAVSKPIGFILYGYCIWLLCDAHALDYQNGTVILCLLASALLAGAFIVCRDLRNPLPDALYPSRQTVLCIEAITLLIYFAYLWLRSHNAAINGTERFMDMALLSASGKTHFFPFADPWYAGKTVNYYYYGYYLISLLSNLAKLPYALSYNFALGLIYAYSALLSATLAYALTDSKKTGAMAAFLITTAGSLFYAWRTVTEFMAGKVYPYASSTRLYNPSYTIREIPSYSFTVGDMHAHVMALPFFMLALILLHALLRAEKPSRSLFPMLALAFATAGMINSWDVITLMSVTGIALFIEATRAFHGEQCHAGQWLAVFPALVLAVGLLMWPDIRDFQSPVLGIGFIPSFVKAHHLADVQYPTSVGTQLGIWGIFAAGMLLSLKIWRGSLPTDVFLSALALGSLGIIAGMELFFVKDIYSITTPLYFRANTTFKFGYHVWIMLCLVFVVWMDRIHHRQDGLPGQPQIWGARLLVIIAVVMGAFYPYQAIRQFYLSNHTGLTLDGAEWMRAKDAGDWDAINYINHTIPDRVVIAEAVGDSYSTHSRITTYTGMITPMGWQSHEWTWRFHVTDETASLPDARKDTGWNAISQVGSDIQTLYQTNDIAQAMQIIKRYDIAYVYVSNKERQAYLKLQEEKFEMIGKRVFSAQNSSLYKIN